MGSVKAYPALYATNLHGRSRLGEKLFLDASMPLLFSCFLSFFKLQTRFSSPVFLRSLSRYLLNHGEPLGTYESFSSAWVACAKEAVEDGKAQEGSDVN